MPSNRENKTVEKKTRFMNPKQPRLHSLKEASEYIGLSPWSLRERIWAGELPVVRFPNGRKMFLDIRDMDRFIERNKMLM